MFCHKLYIIACVVCHFVYKELDRRLQHIVHQPTRYQSQRFVPAVLCAVIREPHFHIRPIDVDMQNVLVALLRGYAIIFLGLIPSLVG